MSFEAAFTLEGHHSQKDILRVLRSHTLLFSGQESIGKRQVARWYAALLNCQQSTEEPCGVCSSCQAFRHESASDYREFSPEMHTKSGKKSRKPQFRIDNLVMREGGDPNPLVHWLEQRPHFSKRVAVIDGAEYLNEAAANALLKTLEEPPSFAVIILLSSRVDAVLPTILSRAVPLRFGTVPIDSDDPQARLGQIGKVKASLEHKDAYNELTSIIDDYIQALSSNLYAALQAADALEKAWLNESPFDVERLLRLRLVATVAPVKVAAVLLEVDACSHALASYVASALAVQVMTLKLRNVLL